MSWPFPIGTQRKRSIRRIVSAACFSLLALTGPIYAQKIADPGVIVGVTVYLVAAIDEQRFAEGGMGNERRPKGKTNILDLKGEPAPARIRDKRLQQTPMRTQEELTPVALRVTENAPLMERFRAVIGSEDEDAAREVLYEVRKFAQSLDPTVTAAEGTRIVLILMKIVGHPAERDQ